jgi:hypothetical protein
MITLTNKTHIVVCSNLSSECWLIKDIYSLHSNEMNKAFFKSQPKQILIELLELNYC